MTHKQQRFVEEYCVDWNATQAAIRAGYSEKTAYSIGGENLKKPEIEAAISERATRLAMSKEEALVRLGQMARASAEDVATATRHEYLDQYVLKIDPGRAIREGKGHLIRELKQTEHGIEVKLHDAKDALKVILQAHGALGAKGTEDDPLHIRPVEVIIVHAKEVNESSG